MPIILLHIVDLLTDAGFHVLAASTSSECVDFLREQGGDIVLLVTDVDMGETTGYAIARAAASLWPSMAILVNSGLHTPEPGDIPEDATFIAKPFVDQEVLGRVRKLLAAKCPHLLADRRLTL